LHFGLHKTISIKEKQRSKHNLVGQLPPREIGPKNQKFLESLKPAAGWLIYFLQWEVIFWHIITLH